MGVIVLKMSLIRRSIFRIINVLRYLVREACSGSAERYGKDSRRTMEARDDRKFLRQLGFRPSGALAWSSDRTHVLVEQPQTLPAEPGVYVFLLYGRQMAHVGQTTMSTPNMRVRTYERPPLSPAWKGRAGPVRSGETGPSVQHHDIGFPIGEPAWLARVSRNLHRGGFDQTIQADLELTIAQDLYPAQCARQA